MADEITSSTQPRAFQANGTSPNGNGNGAAPAPAASAQGAPQGMPASVQAANLPAGAGSAGPGGTAPAGSTPASPQRKAIFAVVGAVAVIGAGIWGARAYFHGLNHVSTDDAFVTGNLVNVSPVVSGTLVKLTVAEGDTVRKGQLIARLDDSREQAALKQARAAYDAAVRQVPEAEANLRYQQESTQAAIRRAEAAAQAQAARTRGAGAQVQLARRTTESQVNQAQSQVRAAQAQAQQAQAQVRTAEEGITAARRAVDAADQGVAVLRARIPAAQADVTRANNDLARYEKLLAQEAVTKQQYDAVRATAETARASLDALNQQISQAQAQAAQARAAVGQAVAQRDAARRAANASAEQVRVAQAGVTLAQAGGGQIAVQTQNYQATQGQEPQAAADIEAARANQQQVAVRREQVSSARAQVAQAQAALEAAQVAEDDTFVYAPADGTVVRKAVNEGAALSPGQTLVTMTQGNSVWVTANFKETQIGNVRIGQPVEVDVDAIKGVKFRGVVASINQATGATTSLLPPDNATGNFTKVVQRLPIKIAIVPGEGDKEAKAEDIARLRQGMSVVAEIDTSDKTAHPERVPANYDGPRETGVLNGSGGSTGGGNVSIPTGQVSGTAVGNGNPEMMSGTANGGGGTAASGTGAGQAASGNATGSGVTFTPVTPNGPNTAVGAPAGGTGAIGRSNPPPPPGSTQGPVTAPNYGGTAPATPNANRTATPVPNLAPPVTTPNRPTNTATPALGASPGVNSAVPPVNPPNVPANPNGGGQ